ncbi:hypothetical protein ACFY7Z_13875 [Streptomyces sp. NPDC012623]|uniref:hypothetical protein n=1 Tax=unclassified Streptomyces TaxID=2593676 RepID=UPI00368CBF73
MSVVMSGGRGVARGGWSVVAVVLAVLIHALACAHGPQPAAGPRADSLPLTSAVAPVSGTASEPRPPCSGSASEPAPHSGPASHSEPASASGPASAAASDLAPAPLQAVATGADASAGCWGADEPVTVDPAGRWTPPGASGEASGKADPEREPPAPERGRAGPGRPEPEWGRPARARAALGVWRT